MSKWEREFLWSVDHKHAISFNFLFATELKGGENICKDLVIPEVGAVSENVR